MPTPRRTSIEIPTFAHVTGIPTASRLGPLLASSIVPPFHPNTREVPDTIEGQVANVFGRVGEILEAAGASWDQIVSMTFCVADLAYRGSLQAPWLERFPDPATRPARHTMLSDPGAPMLVTANFLAWLGD